MVHVSWFWTYFFNKASVHVSSINLLIHSQKSKQKRNKISRIQNPSDIIFFKVNFFLEWNRSWFLSEKKLHLSIFTKIAKKLFRQQEESYRDLERDKTISSSEWNVNTAILVQNNPERLWINTLELTGLPSFGIRGKMVLNNEWLTRSPWHIGTYCMPMKIV